ncbi:CNTNAP5, partial [Symbiodinium sp. KB8]
RPDFSSAQLDYEQLSKADRQDKVDFFELLLVRLKQALKALGTSVPAIQLTASDILGGKNTAESNRMLQLLCYLALRKKLDTESASGIFKLEDQWVTKFTISCSQDGKHWSPFTCGGDPEKPKVRLFEGPETANQVRYQSLWAPGQKLCRLLRLTPVEWHAHAGLRLEVFGFEEDASQATKMPPALNDGGCRLDVVRRQTGLMQRCLTAASAAALDRCRE